MIRSRRSIRDTRDVEESPEYADAGRGTLQRIYCSDDTT